MDRAYEGNETRQLALELNFIPVVPPKSDRVDHCNVRPSELLYLDGNRLEDGWSSHSPHP
jgi:hypothetical protein